jgi:hypothetical protein
MMTYIVINLLGTIYPRKDRILCEITKASVSSLIQFQQILEIAHLASLPQVGDFVE